MLLPLPATSTNSIKLSFSAVTLPAFMFLFGLLNEGIFYILFFLLGGTIAALYSIFRKNPSMQHRLRQARKCLERVKEAEQKSRESGSASEKMDRLLQRATLLREFQSILKEGMTESDLKALTPYLKNTLDQFDLWQEFDIAFDEIHPQFREKVSKRYPQLNTRNIRLCCAIFYGLSNKQIAMLSKKSDKATEQGKTRLRKQMELIPKADIAQILSKL